MKINQVLNEYEYSPQEESKAYDQYMIIKRENPLYAEAFWNMWRQTGNVQAALIKADKEYDRITSESIEEDDINEAVYSVIVNGQEQRYREFRDADVRIFKHIHGLEQRTSDQSLFKSPQGKVHPSKIILKRDGVEVPHKYTGKEKQPITGPLLRTGRDPLDEAMSDAYGIVSAEPEVEGSVEFKQHKNTDKGSVSIEASGDNMQELAKVLKLAGLTLPKDMYSDEQASADDEEPEQEDVLLSPDHEDDKEESPCDSADTDVSYETDKEILINYIKDKLKKSIS
ncbi:hypothetical protein OAA05_00070 [bacterium]|nr:hypothetical protein [bacterium]